MIWKPALIFSSPFKAALTTQFPLNIIWQFNTRYKTQWGRDRYCAGFNYLNDSLQQLLCVYFTLHLKECSLISWNPPPLIFSWTDTPLSCIADFLRLYLPISLLHPRRRKKNRQSYYDHHAQLTTDLIVSHCQRSRQDGRGLQYGIVNSVVAAFNWCEITFSVEA